MKRLAVQHGAATARVEFAMPARRSATPCLSRTATAVAGSNEIKLRKNADIISVALEFGPHSHKNISQKQNSSDLRFLLLPYLARLLLRLEMVAHRPQTFARAHLQSMMSLP